MYLEHFGLREYPFTLTPDTSYFLASHHHQAALNTLLVAIDTGEGFIKITGEVGTGKTLLCRQFLTHLEHLNSTQAAPKFVSAYIPNPYLTPHSLMMSLADELEIALEPGVGQHHLLKAISHALLAFANQDRQVILCLDEAQAMPIETLEALRLLTNLETEKRKLLQIVLFGQPELDQKLQHHSIRQLNQRISFHYQLGKLSPAELARYIEHRLQIAGYPGRPIFTRRAINALHQASGGIPRLVNILAHKALMLSFGTGEHQIGAHQISVAADDTQAAHKIRHYRHYAAIALVMLATGLGWVISR
ncbi:AAA family ATPase [Sulfuriferula sp. AH1]|uniref:ExeA family protein n=1 Tax=Sulfuriferula sp. AH1 TaxID=1985873 RepID=UPI000B3B4BF7|nr:AAA family ATPase [Sulfuriferula sp. AH1]ARU31007.1 AAA family ATPase [Sulfuriferula sp. AH1]